MGDKNTRSAGRRSLSAMIILGMLVLSLVLLPSPAAAAGIPYVVKAGDTLSQIAVKYGVTVQALMRANGLTTADYIRVGQKLTIPAPGEAQAATGDTQTYVVKAGDSIGSIALTLGVSQAALLMANNLSNPNLIRIGQKLVIPGASGANTQRTVSDPSTLPAAPDRQHYTVRAGDSLGEIAQTYGVTEEALAEANGLTDSDYIYIGMELTIPAPEGATVATGQDLRFAVSISKQRCWLYNDDLIMAEWPCSTGQYGSTTNPGTYFVQSKVDKAFGSSWNIWMPYWLGIYWAGGSENGIHGIPYNAATGWRLWEGYVGKPVTYGCVLLDDANAKFLYDLAYIGMPVIIQP